MAIVRRVYKFGTGDVIPEGAEYLTTEVVYSPMGPSDRVGPDGQPWHSVLDTKRYVWHYFLVEVPLDGEE